MMAKLWSVSALAVELGRDRRSLARDLEGLAPDEETTTGGRVHRRYRMARVVEHLYRRPDGEALDLDTERALLAQEQRWKLERQRLLDEGRLLDTEKVAEEVGNYISVCCARLHVVPGRVSAELDQDTGRRVEPLVRRVIFEAIQELRDYRPDTAPTPEARADA